MWYRWPLDRCTEDHVLPFLEDHLNTFVGAGTDAWLFPGQGDLQIHAVSLDRKWREARIAIGKPEVRFHDLRHSGLTLTASAGATITELMKRGGHSSPAASLRYQHASQQGDRDLADRLAVIAGGPTTGTPGEMGHAGARRHQKPLAQRIPLHQKSLMVSVFRSCRSSRIWKLQTTKPQFSHQFGR